MRLSQLLTPWNLLQTNPNRRRPVSPPPRYKCHIEPLEDRCLLTAGTLDLTFGGTGMVFPGGADAPNRVSDITIQEDQKIVSFSQAWDGENQLGVLTRHNPNGSLDTDFGDGGRSSIDFVRQASSSDREIVRAVALDSDGGTYVGSSISYFNGEPINKIALARFQADGTLDTSFGKRGKVVTELGLGRTILHDITVHDGKLIVVGSNSVGDYWTEVLDWDILIARFNRDGSLDPTFGNGAGFVTTDFGGNQRAEDVAVNEAGEIFVTGQFFNDLTLVKYNSDGTLSTEFGLGGSTATALKPGGGGKGEDLTIQADGKIVVLGFEGEAGMVRYNADGSLDTSFGVDGIVLNAEVVGSDPLAFALDANGKIVIAAAHIPTQRTLVYRHNPDGTLDSTFAQDGTLSLPVTSESGGFFTGGLQIQNDGRIVFGGYSPDATGYPNAVLIRLLGDPPPPAPPGFTVTPTSGLETSEDGGTATFTVVLNAMPSDVVIILVASTDSSEGTTTVTELIFTPQNWNVSQTVTVVGVDDSEKDGSQSYSIELTIDTQNTLADEYLNLNPDDVFLTNKDNEKGKGGPKH